MSSNVDGQFESKPMNAMSDVATVNRYAKRLEDTEAQRLGIRTAAARKRIAGRIGVSPGTLENLRRLRTKVVPNWLMERVRAELVSVLQQEIQGLEHEVHVARQTGSNYRDDTLASAAAQLAAAREILRGEVK